MLNRFLRLARRAVMAAAVCCFLAEFSASASVAAEASLSDLIDRIEPAVVRIDVTTKNGKGTGSGFVVDPQGIVVTNHHVMAESTQGKVTFKNGDTASVLGTLYLDERRDIAVIKIDRILKVTLPLASAQQPRKGESVAAFGTPIGFSFTATQGIVSGIRDGKELAEFIPNLVGTWIQTNATITHGNSGGPLVNMAGEVVGANTLALPGGQNFAISAVDISAALKSALGSRIVPLAEGAAKARTPKSIPRDELAADAIGSDRLAAFVQTGQASKAARVGEVRKAVREVRSQIRQMKSGLIDGLGAEARAAGKDYTIVQVGVDRAYHFPDDATKERCIKAGQRFVDRAEEILKKLDDPERGFVNFLMQFGPELAPEAVGQIGCVSDMRVLRILDDEMFVTWVGDKAVVVRGMKTKELATGSNLDGRAMFVAGTLSIPAKGGGSNNVFVLRELPEEMLTPHLSALKATSAASTGGKAKEKVVAAKPKLDSTASNPASAAKPAPAAAGKEPSAGNSGDYRTWTDKSGKFKVEAQLVTKDETQVVLKRRDNGKVLTIPIANLSPADQEFVAKKP